MSATTLSAAAANTSNSRKAKPKAKPKKNASGPGKAKSRAPKSTRSKASPKTPTKKTPPKATRKASPKAKAKRRPARAVNSKPIPKNVARIWTACFVYANAAGTANIAIRRIRANDEEKAREIALKTPPGEEFMLTIVPESDEQFLGQVRLKAISSAENRV